MTSSDLRRRHHHEPHRRSRQGERGYVLVMLSLCMVLLLAFAGFSVDLGNWNLQRNEVRSVAEAAALGGVAFLPDDFTTARLTAEALAEAQGVDRSEVTVALGSAPNRLRVTVTREVENYFVRVIGMDTRTISETAEAEFEQPVDMGSPTIVLGNDPDTGWSPDYWLSIAGRGVDKALGDRFATRNCTFGTAGCAGPNNTEWDPSGYHYSVRVTDATQPLRIQVFDPAWVWTGSACNIPDFPTPAEIAALVASSGTHPHIPAGYYDDAATRYAAGPGDYCMGDDLPGLTGPATTFTVRLPDTSPWDDTDNPIVPVSSCSPVTFPAYTPESIYLPPTESIFDLLTEGGDTEWQVRDDGTFTFAEVFRRWVTICEIPPGPWLRTATTSCRSRPTTAPARTGSRSGPVRPAAATASPTPVRRSTRGSGSRSSSTPTTPTRPSTWCGSRRARTLAFCGSRSSTSVTHRLPAP